VMLPQLKAFGARHLHAHFATNSTEVAMLAHALGGPPYSFTVHGTGEFDKIQQLGINEKVSRAAFVVAICSHGRSQLFRALDHALWAKVQLVHCGLEPAFHNVAPTPPPLTPRLVCVGRLCKEKGQLLLIEAAYQLAQEGIQFELVLAGDGEMRGVLESLLSRYGLSKQIRITGWISSDQVRSEILAAQALVLPSFSEGLPIVIMEAMALRRPVLTTYVGGIPELVQHGKNGWLFPAGSVDALAAAMRECFAATQPGLEAMGAAAHERVLASHSIDAEVSKLAHLYKTTLESNAVS
jgi:colanic acid/amylovoran biosynthesis glycosyltransferase